MKKSISEYSIPLSNKGVDECSALIQEFLKEIKQPHKDVMRYAISVEELLISFMNDVDGEPESKTVVLKMGKRLFRHFIEISIEGEPLNVFLEDEKDRPLLVGTMLKTINLTPEFRYHDNNNVYTYVVKKKKLNPFVILAIALVAAFVVGALGNIMLPESVKEICVSGLLVPAHDAFLNVLGCVAGPMIFLSVAWGIYGIGDIATFKQIGGRLLGSYVAVLYIATVVLGLMCIPIFKPHFAASTSVGAAVLDLVKMLFDILPANIFSPFVDGNTLQIIFLGIIVGIALMFLGRRTETIAVIVEQINIIVQFLIEVISALVPYFIFVVLVEMLWSDTISVVKSVGKLFGVYLICVFLFNSAMVIYTGIRNKVNPLILLEKGLPTLATGITTASSAACFGINLQMCRESLGIDDKIVSFGLPLGMVSFKVNTSFNYLTMAIFFAQMYGVDISVTWVVIMLFTAGILAIATPPIPGGAASAYAVLMAQCGIPADALAIALAVDVLFDFVDTGFDQFCIPYQLLNQSAKLGLVDRKQLLKKTDKNKK